MTKDITNRSELDIVVIKLNEMGIRTSSGLEFNRNRLSALMSKIKNRKSTILKAS